MDSLIYREDFIDEKGVECSTGNARELRGTEPPFSRAQLVSRAIACDSRRAWTQGDSKAV